LEETDPLTSMLELEDRMRAVLGVQLSDLAGTTLERNPGHDVAEEAHDRPRGHVDLFARRRAEMRGRVYERLAVRVELEDRVSGTKKGAGRGARRSGRIATGDG
jgi:hypothetical protein